MLISIGSCGALKSRCKGLYVSFYLCVGLLWHLKRCQHVKLIRSWIEDWPSDANQLQDLSKELVEVSHNLKHLEDLVSPILYAILLCGSTV